MASSPSLLVRQSGWQLLPAIARLAQWRFRQMWHFLFVTWLGMLAVVVLVCTLPLFSRVAITADLRSTVANAPSGHNIIIQVDSFAPTTTQLQQLSQQVHYVLKESSFGSYLASSSTMVVQTPPLTVLVDNKATPLALFLDGSDPAQAAQHVTLVQGRLPQVTTDGSTEIALVQDVASSLGIHVGSIIQGRYPASFGAKVWNLHVVGIITPPTTNAAYWAAETNPFGTQHSLSNGATAYSVLAPLGTITPQIAALHATTGGGDPWENSFHLFWSYPFDLSRLDANNVSTLSQQASDLQWPIANTLTHIQGVSFAFPVGALFDILSGYGQQIVVLNIVITFLLLLILAIILFLISMLADILVERQAEVIATLRSRGATRQHVFGSFIVQGIVLSIAALIAGPLLAILLVELMASVLLSPTNQQALNVLTAQPLQAILNIKWYALLAISVALLVMIVSISRASHLDIVTLRRESSRTKHVSLWRRLNLDLLVVILIAVGYIAYAYISNTLATAQAFDPVLYNLLNIGGFIAPPLLIVAILMLFLRFFPRILHLATYLVAKKRSASALLAFAQMERSPRPTARIIVLLALAIAASCFLGTLMQTKQARTVAAANFAVGADFSGPLPASASSKTFTALQTQYSQISGVQSATLGYDTIIPRNNGDLHIAALDAATFAQTAVWSTQNSAQPLSTLTKQLVAHRPDATSHNVVYALVDAALWHQLQLSPGDSFTLPASNNGTVHIHFVALAQISYIPGLYDTPIDTSQGVGLLVDYQSYASVYAKANSTALAPNLVLLRTKDDATSLAHIRTLLPGFSDRRQLIADSRKNAVHIDILGVLAIGVTAALLLALVGTLLSSWLNASNRRTNFAVMRALGMAPRSVAALLLWEQSFTYILAFLLGIGLGALLTIFTVPAVSLLDLSGSAAQNNPYDVPPVMPVIPYQQFALLLGGLVLVCLIAILLMALIVSRPSIGQTLRLNED